jgi:hypothetical protein
MEQKKDGISRLSRGFGVPGRYRSLDPPPDALKFASAGGFWRVLDTSSVLVGARWLWWDRAWCLALDGTTPSVLVVESWSPGRAPLGEIADAAYSGVGEWTWMCGREFTTLWVVRRDSRQFGGTRERSVRSSLAPSTAVFRFLRNIY